MFDSVSMFWESIKDLDYVVLRNYTDLENLLGTNEDIDILCADKEEFVNIINAIPLNHKTECYNYYVIIDGKRLYIDIRCVGDGCYDEKWEKDMLLTRVPYKNTYILNSEHSRYSILYHALFQKKIEAQKKYAKLLCNQFNQEKFDENFFIETMRKFMIEKKYHITKPIDTGIYENKVNIQKILELGGVQYGRKNKRFIKI